jgi:AraC-like DNA-binding protein
VAQRETSSGNSSGDSRTLPIDLVRSATQFAIRQGWDVNGLLHEAGIPPMLLAEGRARITEKQAASVVRTLWRQTDDEMFGIGTNALPRGSFRLLCYGVLGAPDLGAALDRFQGFAAAVPAIPPVGMTKDGGTVRMSWDIGAARSSDPEHLMAMAALSVSHRLMSWAIRQEVPLVRVELPYPEPPNVETHQLVFGAPLVFDCEQAALIFDAEILRAPLMRDEKELDEFIARAPAGLLVRQDYGTSVSDRVLKLVEQGLKGEHSSGEEIAARLAMSPQTLRRKLASEGTSLRDIREQVLRDAAVTSLVQGEETMAELAERLGFSEPSAFTRAFRRWTGSPPSAYRSGSDG